MQFNSQSHLSPARHESGSLSQFLPARQEFVLVDGVHNDVQRGHRSPLPACSAPATLVRFFHFRRYISRGLLGTFGELPQERLGQGSARQLHYGGC